MKINETLGVEKNLADALTVPSLDGAASQEDFDLDDRKARRIERWQLVGLGALMYGFLIVGAIFGGCRWLSGTRGWAIRTWIDPLLYAAFYSVMIQGWIMWPVTQWSYRQLRLLRWPAVRVALSTTLIVVPLLAYGYYRGQLKTGMDYYELWLAVFPGAFLTALFYDHTRRMVDCGLFLAFATFIPFFVVNDLMSPFPTWASYATSQNFFFWCRSLFPLSAVVLGIYFNWRNRKTASVANLE